MLLFILVLSSYSAEKCVIDRCEDTLCVLETPEGTIIIDKKPSYTEGQIIQCPARKRVRAV